MIDWLPRPTSPSLHCSFHSGILAFFQFSKEPGSPPSCHCSAFAVPSAWKILSLDIARLGPSLHSGLLRHHFSLPCEPSVSSLCPFILLYFSSQCFFTIYLFTFCFPKLNGSSMGRHSVSCLSWVLRSRTVPDTWEVLNKYFLGE